MRCTLCGQECREGLLHCPNCSTPLPNKAPEPLVGLSARCGTCSLVNAAGMKFCRNCGTALPPPVAPMPPPPAQVVCTECQGQTPAGSKFCQHCGGRLARGRAPATSAPPLDAAAARIPAPAQAVPTQAAPPPAAVRAQGTPGAAILPLAAATPRPAHGAAPVAAAPAPVTMESGWGTAILVNRDGSDGSRHDLSAQSVVLGRTGCDLSFEQDRFVARVHARIERSVDAVRVVPVDLVNGVFRKIDAATELTDGAIVLVGREILRLELLDRDESAGQQLVEHGVAMFGSPQRDSWARMALLLPSGDARDVRHLSGSEVVLGRGEGEIIFSDDAFMSRRHAALRWDGQRVTLQDLGSSNGTFVRLTGPMVLRHGDHLRMGDQLLRIEFRR
jgi:hypothetical protein